MTLNQCSVNVHSTLYACWVLSLHYVILLGDGTDTKCLILKVGTAKFDLEFDRTSLKCMGLSGREPQSRASY